MSVLCRILATAAMFMCCTVHADLSTGHIASIEWKSFSSDAVLLVSVESGSNNIPTTKLVEVFHRRGDELASAASLLQSWKLLQPDERRRNGRYPEDWRPDGEWLLFVRKWEDSEPTIDHVVYLENPRQASWMSAVNAKGQLLMEKAEILAVVKNRLEDGKRMTKLQRGVRKLVDQGEHRKSDWWGRNDSTLPYVSPWLGGFQVPVNISVWDDYDEKRSFHEDLWITSVTVPADDSFREALINQWTSYLKLSRESRKHNVIGYPSVAFINYPSQKNEELLMRMSRLNPEAAVVPINIAEDAMMALEYLQFYESSFDEQDRKLLGSWEITRRHERVQLDLLEDHQLITHRKPIPYPSQNEFEEERFSKGRWNLHRGRLLLLSKEYQLSTGEKGLGRPELPALDKLAIIKVEKDAITFEKDTVLKRAPQPIPKVTWAN